MIGALLLGLFCGVVARMRPGLAVPRAGLS
jgi:hypothetical protein